MKNAEEDENNREVWSGKKWDDASYGSFFGPF